MKKTTRSLLISSLILLCAGLLLSIGSAIFVKIKGIDPYGVKPIEETIENKSISLTDILSLSPEANFTKKLSDKEFLRLEITSFAGDVIVRAAEETSIELKDTNTSNLSYEIVGETLQFGEKDPVGIMGVYIDKGGFTFEGLRQVFGPGNSANTEKCMIVNIANGFELDEIDINSKLGDITIDGISAKVLDVSSFSGKVTIQNLQKSETKIDCRGSNTDIELKDSAYSSCSLSTKAGSIKAHIRDLNNLSTVAETWIGDVLIETDIPTKEYKLKLSSSTGKVLRNGEECGEELQNAAVNSTRITSSSFFGDVAIQFTGGNEDQYVSVGSEPVPDENAATAEGDAAAA